MRLMSFALTTEQVRNQTKTVTRRKGWKSLEVGEYIQPVEKCQGLKAGEKVQKIGCPIRIVSVSRETLICITKDELDREGFPGMTAEDFIKMYCKANGGDEYQLVTRVLFMYTKPKVSHAR